MEIKKQYVKKYSPTRDETYKAYQIANMKNKIDEYEEKKMFWKIFPFVLLFVFAIFAIYVMIAGG